MSPDCLKAALLVLTKLFTPVWYPPGAGPETVEQRSARYEMITEVNVEASFEGHTEFWPADNAALVLAIQRGESMYGYYVHGGEPSPIGHQDNGRAKCLSQIHWHKRKWPKKEDWLALAGRSREATKRCTVATLEILWTHAKRCKLRKNVPIAQRWKAPLSTYEVRVLIRAYGTGVSCSPVSAKHKKVVMYEWARGQL